MTRSAVDAEPGPTSFLVSAREDGIAGGAVRMLVKGVPVASASRSIEKFIAIRTDDSDSGPARLTSRLVCRPVVRQLTGHSLADRGRRMRYT